MRTEDEMSQAVELGTARDALPGGHSVLPPSTGAPDPGGRRRLSVRRTIRGYLDLRRTPYGLRPAIVFGAIAFFQVFDTRAFSVAGPDVVRALGINISSIIDIISIVAIVATFAGIAAGWWVDRHRRVPFFAISTALAGVFAMLSSFARSTVSLGVPRVGDDVSNTAADVPSFSLLADYYPPEARGRVFAFLSTMGRVGQIMAIGSIGFMIKYLGFRKTFVVTGAPIVVLGLLALVLLRDPIRGYFERSAAGASDEVARREDEPQSLGEGWRTVWSVRTVRRVAGANVFLSFEGALTGAFVGFFLFEKYGLDAVQRSLIQLPSVLFALVGGFYGGALVDRFTQRNPGRVLLVYGIFPLVGAIGMVGYAMQPPLVLLVVFGCINAFGVALVGPAGLAVYSQVIPPSVRTQGQQMTALASLPGMLLGLQMGKVLFAQHGYASVFLSSIPFTVVGAAVAMTAASFFDLDRRNQIAASVAAEDFRRARAAGEDKLLVCRDLDVAYDGVQVLFGVDFDVRENQIIALLGTNGAGKSTLLRAISGSQEASAGAIVFNGRDITHMPPHEIAGRGVVHMPGGRGVFPGLSVRENLLLGNWVHEGEEGDDIAGRLAEVFEIFPVLRDRAGTLAGALSGGEQQQLSLAQAFLMKPKLLMIDELSLGLSPAVVGQLLDVVREIHRRGVTIIVVEQSVNVALTIADKAIFMEKGEVKFFGDTADLLSRPDILRAVYVKGTGALSETPGSSSAGARQRARELTEARPVLEVADIVKRYGGVTALDGVSLGLREGEVLGIIGPNGSGKTTLFDIISGFQRADGGRVLFEGVDITDESPEQRSRRKLIRRFQDARLFPSLTVFETLMVALEERVDVKSPLLHAAALPSARRSERRTRARAERLVELLELGTYRDKFVKELSTGLRRIVDLACVLAAEPRVLLLDEPSSGIAQAEAEGLAPLLRRVRFETGCSILIIEHDMPLISAVSDQLIALDRGKVVLQGEPAAVLNDDRVIEAYLGGSEAAINRSGGLQ
jgi:branched-chain amino acid transport system ATP-binding protein